MAVIHCLGVGLVGSYVAKRLAESGHVVHAYDPSPHRVEGVSGIFIHYLEPDEDPIDAMAKVHTNDEGCPIDMVVNMLPGSIGHTSTTILAESPWRTIDLSFSNLTPDRDSEKAKEFGASILWDVGIAPGLSNMLLSEAHRKLGPLLIGEVRVGGNPTEHTSGWNYMAPFSPSDVIAEYTRPARVIRDSEEVTLPALSERHSISVLGKGEMEAFLTDGLRSVLNSIPAVNMSEYTVRWPGHIQMFIDERDSGMLDEEKLTIDWQYNPMRTEFTWMEVTAQSHDGTKMEWRIQDHGGDDGHSMARCTGLVTFCCIEEWLDNSDMLPVGVHAPESLPSDVISRILEKMILRGVEIEGPVFSKSSDH
ncbi:MAG TPA: saccharopine dehydrogenase C-terminal domain-containing protein [Candidatus Thalassarchaeaceae archaeon]|nr:saccharopine dehydrogenase C-terminal domain-containing protein [Candidatus Thalassarchaeaceae archaeon]|tara:strand:- start:63779 stop:64870 length:1092 start_codon:yes stop_codon:yes gene_type:complete